MDDNEYFDDDIDTDPTPEPDADRTPAALRRAAKEGRQAKAELEAARRELALVKAGVDTESKVGRLFARAYDGELDIATIKAEWAEVAGVAPAPAADPVDDGPQFVEGETDSTAQRQALANNAPADQVNAEPDPRVHVGDLITQTIHDGASTEEALAKGFDFLVGKAMEGDDRVVIKAF